MTLLEAIVTPALAAAGVFLALTAAGAVRNALRALRRRRRRNLGDAVELRRSVERAERGR